MKLEQSELDRFKFTTVYLVQNFPKTMPHDADGMKKGYDKWMITFCRTNTNQAACW